MLDEMSSRELSEWLMYWTVSPWGMERHDLGHAMTSSIVANVNRKKGRRAFVPNDFMPYVKRAKIEREKPRTQLDVLKKARSALGKASGQPIRRVVRNGTESE